MKLKNYYLIGAKFRSVVLAENIKIIRNNFPDHFIQYSGPLTKNELFLGLKRIKGNEIAPGVFENKLYL